MAISMPTSKKSLTPMAGDQYERRNPMKPVMSAITEATLMWNRAWERPEAFDAGLKHSRIREKSPRRWLTEKRPGWKIFRV